MQKTKVILFVILLLISFKISSVFAIFGLENIIENLISTENKTETVDITFQRYLVNALQFLYLIAVIYGIYGGFLILTAGEDKEEKVKKGKTIIIQAIIGIVVIFLANSIVTFVIGGPNTQGILSDGSGSGATTP